MGCSLRDAQLYLFQDKKFSGETFESVSQCAVFGLLLAL